MHRAKLDKNDLLHKFAQMLEDSTIETVESGCMTKDLAITVFKKWDVKKGDHFEITEKYMDKVDENFQRKWKNVVM